SLAPCLTSRRPSHVCIFYVPAPVSPETYTLSLHDALPIWISTGAVSPMTRATARKMPEIMPDSAVGMTMLTMVFHLGTPSAYEASRSSSGTSLSISSVDRTMSGIMSSTRARLTAKALSSNWNVVIQMPKMKIAATTEGTPARTSTMNVVGLASLESGYSTSMMPAATPSGIEMTAATTAWTRLP